MVRASQARISRFIRDGENAQTTRQRGAALEALIRYFFETVPGLSLTNQDQLDIFHAQEIDLMFWNDQHPKGLNFLPRMFFAECKNWVSPVGSAEVSLFDRKLQDHGLDFGIIVAMNGISGDATQLSSAHQIIAAALRERRDIVVITRSEVEAVRTSGDIVDLMKRKLVRLHARRTSL